MDVAGLQNYRVPYLSNHPCRQFHFCTVFGWLYLRNAALGVRYLGKIRNSDLRAYNHTLFQNASRRPAGHHDSWLRWNERRFIIFNTCIYFVGHIYSIEFDLITILQLVDHIWGSFSNSDELNSQMGAHGPLEASPDNPILAVIWIGDQSRKASPPSSRKLRYFVLHNQRLDEPHSRKDQLLEEAWKFDFKNHRGCPSGRW